MLIFKQRRIGGAVNPHQDSTFLFTDPPSCIGLWTALQVSLSIWFGSVFSHCSDLLLNIHTFIHLGCARFIVSIVHPTGCNVREWLPVGRSRLALDPCAQALCTQPEWKRYHLPARARRARSVHRWWCAHRNEGR